MYDDYGDYTAPSAENRKKKKKGLGALRGNRSAVAPEVDEVAGSSRFSHAAEVHSPPRRPVGRDHSDSVLSGNSRYGGLESEESDNDLLRTGKTSDMGGFRTAEGRKLKFGLEEEDERGSGRYGRTNGYSSRRHDDDDDTGRGMGGMGGLMDADALEPISSSRGGRGDRGGPIQVKEASDRYSSSRRNFDNSSPDEADAPPLRGSPSRLGNSKKSFGTRGPGEESEESDSKGYGRSGSGFRGDSERKIRESGLHSSPYDRNGRDRDEDRDLDRSRSRDRDVGRNRERDGDGDSDGDGDLYQDPRLDRSRDLDNRGSIRGRDLEDRSFSRGRDLEDRSFSRGRNPDRSRVSDDYHRKPQLSDDETVDVMKPPDLHTSTRTSRYDEAFPRDLKAGRSPFSKGSALPPLRSARENDPSPRRDVPVKRLDLGGTSSPNDLGDTKQDLLSEYQRHLLPGIRKSDDLENEALASSRRFKAPSGDLNLKLSSDRRGSVTSGEDIMQEMKHGSSMEIVKTQDARTRAEKDASEMGDDRMSEMERVLPQRILHVFVMTWNMCEQPDTRREDLLKLLHPDSSKVMHDLYVIGTQESLKEKKMKEWDIAMQSSLGEHFVPLYCGSHGCLHLAVFLRRELLWYCSDLDVASVTTRFGSAFVTKGCHAVALYIFGSSFLFMNSHFTAGDEKKVERMSNYHKTRKELKLPGKKLTLSMQDDVTAEDVTERFDRVFWLGDFNFRIDALRETVINKLKDLQARETVDYEELLQHDELMQAQKQDEIFEHFQEGRVRFAPTYKFDIGTNDYDTSERMRIPSYTDRVLFRSREKNRIVCLTYDSVGEVSMSDHKAVFGSYQIQVVPRTDRSMPPCAGLFRNDIYAQGLEDSKYSALGRMIINSTKPSKRPPRSPSPARRSLDSRGSGRAGRMEGVREEDEIEDEPDARRGNQPKGGAKSKACVIL